jgi:hypothetical protein
VQGWEQDLVEVQELEPAMVQAEEPEPGLVRVLAPGQVQEEVKEWVQV